MRAARVSQLRHQPRELRDHSKSIASQTLARGNETGRIFTT